MQSKNTSSPLYAHAQEQLTQLQFELLTLQEQLEEARKHGQPAGKSPSLKP